MPPGFGIVHETKVIHGPKLRESEGVTRLNVFKDLGFRRVCLVGPYGIAELV